MLLPLTSHSFDTKTYPREQVLRAILQAFAVFSAPAQPQAASGAAAERASGRAAATKYGKKLEQVIAFTGCTEEVALDCLEATGGDVEHASILALDAVGNATA